MFSGDMLRRRFFGIDQGGRLGLDRLGGGLSWRKVTGIIRLGGVDSWDGHGFLSGLGFF